MKEVCASCASTEAVYHLLGRWYCQECASGVYHLCEACGGLRSITSMTYRDGGYYCNEDCLQRDFAICEACGQSCYRTVAHQYGEKLYCTRCFDRNFYRCAFCREVGKRGEAFVEGGRYFCGEQCYEDNEMSSSESGLVSATYRPKMIFHRFPYERSVFMGVEMEYDTLPDETVLQMRRLDKECRKIYFKTDITVAYGFEVVSHPMTLAKHREFDWAKVMEISASNGGTTKNVGLHIHMQKCSALEYAKMEQFFWKNGDFIFLFSRRRSDDLERWARIGKPSCLTGVLKEVKEGDFYRESRYIALNPTEDTVEVRIFNSTQTSVQFYAALEFCHSLYYFVKTMGMGKFYNSSCLVEYLNFIKEDREYKNLRKFLLEEVFVGKGWESFAKILKKGGEK